MTSYCRKTWLSGRALYLAIIISFIAAIIAFMFLLSKHYRFVELLNTTAVQQLNDNIESTITLLIQDKNNSQITEEQSFFLYNDSLNRVNASRKKWGCFGIISARATMKQLSIKKVVIYGIRTGGDDAVGLYLADHGHYLAVGGDTYLSGNCFLPALGVRKAYIDGKSFKYQDIVHGTTNKSEKELPKLSDDLLQYIKTCLFDVTPNDSVVNEAYLNEKVINNSFWNKTVRIYSDEEIILSNKEIKGNIIIQSLKKIKIRNDLKTENIICISPRIEVEDDFEGCIQLFANDTILIGKDVKILYPGSLAVLGFERSTANITIGPASKIEGVVLAYAEIEANNNVSVVVGKGTEIFGTVYCKGKVSLTSKIFGSLYCDMFSLQTDQGYYENHILDTWIHPVGLEEKFASGLLFDQAIVKSQSKQIILNID